MAQDEIENSVNCHFNALTIWDAALDREEHPDMIEAYTYAGSAFIAGSYLEDALHRLEQAFELSMKMYKGFDLSKQSWFNELCEQIEKVIIDLKSGDKKVRKLIRTSLGENTFQEKSFAQSVEAVQAKMPGPITSTLVGVAGNTFGSLFRK